MLVLPYEVEWEPVRKVLQAARQRNGRPAPIADSGRLTLQTGINSEASLSPSTPHRPSLPLAIVTVAYDSLQPLESLANDLTRQSHAPQHWLVVDNAPRSAPLQLTGPLQAAGVRRLEGQEGAGFGEGCNQAFESLAAECWQGWVWLLNPDTQLPRTDLLRRITALLTSLPAQALVGTAVLSDQGELEASGGWIDPGLAFRRRHLNDEHQTAAHEQPLPVNWLSGCSLALRPSSHEPPARFDPMFPLYYEDMDLCLRLAQKGALVLWSSGVSIRHQRGRGSGGNSVRRVRLNTVSYWRFLQRHSPAWVRGVRGLRLLMISLLRLPWQPAYSQAVLQGWLEAWMDPIQ